MKTILSFVLIAFICLSANASEVSPSEKRTQYIEQWKDVAMAQMQSHGIPASITLAQGILESGNGMSELTRKSNNHFGIKCHSTWKGKKVYYDDDKRNECFRKYKNAAQSFEDHSQFLLKKRYEPLFALKANDYKGWAKGLRKAGYATDPSYSKKLIKIIEDNNLHAYDKLVLKGKFDGKIEEEPIAEVKQQNEKPTVKSTRKTKSVPVIDLVGSYNVRTHPNKIKYVIAQGGENVDDLATRLDMAPWQLKKYNDLGSRKKLDKGEKVFIQPKRGKSNKSTHTVKKGETMRDISQKYGVKISKIEKYNNLSSGATAKAGVKLKLSK